MNGTCEPDLNSRQCTADLDPRHTWNVFSTLLSGASLSVAYLLSFGRLGLGRGQGEESDPSKVHGRIRGREGQLKRRKTCLLLDLLINQFSILYVPQL